MNLITKKYYFLPDEKKTGKKIKELRIKYFPEKMTVSNLKGKIDDYFGVEISEKTINKWEQGKSFPMYENLLFLSKIFNVTIQSLLLPDLYENLSLNSKIYNLNYEDVFLEKQYPELFKDDLSNEINSREIMDFLFQKAIFSYLSPKEKELFELRAPDFFSITNYGSEKYSNENNILNIINTYVNEMYGYRIKQRIPDDNDFNSIMFSVLKIVNHIDFEKNNNYIFSYLYDKEDNTIDNIIANLNLIERDYMLTAMLTLPFNCYNKLQKIYDSLIKHGAKRLVNKNKEKFYFIINIEVYEELQFQYLSKFLIIIGNYFKTVTYDEYLHLRRNVSSNDYKEELINLKEVYKHD